MPVDPMDDLQYGRVPVGPWANIDTITTRIDREDDSRGYAPARNPNGRPSSGPLRAIGIHPEQHGHRGVGGWGFVPSTRSRRPTDRTTEKEGNAMSTRTNHWQPGRRPRSGQGRFGQHHQAPRHREHGGCRGGKFVAHDTPTSHFVD